MTTTQTETLFVVLSEQVDELYDLIQQPRLKNDYFVQSHLLLAYLLCRREDKTHTETMERLQKATRIILTA